MGNVMVIPARRQVGNTVKQSAQKKLRVAAYCRVSTDSEEQETSYEAQVTHYTEYIQKNPEWELAGIFADDGISGTNTKKRDEFNRMIDECMVGNIDMVITKSISRFARNTLDCLQYIRQLKDKNIPVYFEKEAINTLDAKGEVLITIMASLAQQESQSMSQNIKLGLQYRYQQGKVQVNHNRFLGYTKDDNGHRSSILRRGRPRGDHSERSLHAGAGGACPSPGSPRQPDRQETQLLLQSLFCADGVLRGLWRALPARPLEQPRLQVHRLALHQSLGAHLRWKELYQPDGKRAPAAGGHGQGLPSDSYRAGLFP